MGETSITEFINFASRTTKIKLAMLLLLSVLFVTLAIFSIVTFWRFYKGPQSTVALEGHREIASVSPHEDFSKPYEIKGLSVGFMDRKDTRMAYAQFTLVFNCLTEACKKNLVMNHARVLDTVFEVSSEFYVEDFTEPSAKQGFSQFKSKLTDHLRTKFASLAPKGVVIQEWFLN